MDQIKQLHRQAQLAINQRDYPQAHACCVQIIQLQPNHADSYFLLGIIHIELGQINKAIKLIEQAIAHQSEPEYWVHLSKCFALQGNMREALACAEQVPADKLSRALDLDTLGVALSRIGLHQHALVYFQKALSLENNNPAFFYNYAVSSKFAGLFSQAREAFERAIALKPDYYQAHFALSDLGEISAQHNHIDRLTTLLSQPHSVAAGLHLGHALAKEYEATGEYRKALLVLQQVKQARLQQQAYDFSQDLALFDTALAISQPTARAAGEGWQDAAPIFVMGMPRSGTTLVERILSNHSQVDSCGELQDFGVAVKELCATPSANVLDVATLVAAQSVDMAQLGQRYIERTRAVRGDAPRFVDKLPFNFFYLGLIRRALPKAKIVILQRNPMDTCIGNFRQLFSINSPYYGYAFDLLSIGRFYQQFDRLSQFWREQEDDNLLLLDYQQLVAEPETQIRRLLAFCQLDWQAQCVQVEKNRAPVSTASKMQVREPINQKSLGRWRHYGELTLPLQQFFTRQGIAIE